MYIAIVLKDYKFCSPSVHVDQTWQAVTDYQEQILRVKETSKEQL